MSHNALVQVIFAQNLMKHKKNINLAKNAHFMGFTLVNFQETREKNGQCNSAYSRRQICHSQSEI